MIRFLPNPRQLAVAAFAAIAASMLLASVAVAQSPPTPPSRFVGNVRIDGANAPAGTAIEARIGSTTCGVTTVFNASGEARYALDSPALEPTQNPNCGTDGSAVTFFVGGKQANETGTWRNYQLNTVNLTVSSAPAPTPTRTPAPPTAGTTTGSQSAATLPILELLLLASALGLTGVGVAARVRRS